MNAEYFIKVSILAPCIAFMALLLIPPLRHRGRLAGWLVSGATLCCLVSAMTLVMDQFQHPNSDPMSKLYPWLTIKGVAYAQIGWLVDGISSTMLLVTSLIALCVQVYSQGYFSEATDPERGRYFTGHALLVFAMNIFVVSPNLLQLFMGAQLVGLSSYVLLRYDWPNQAISRASMRAFLITHSTSVFTLLGVIILFVTTKSFDWTVGRDLGESGEAFNLAAGLVFIGVMGRSAQWPFHTWLPGASAAPSPLSAIIFSAAGAVAGIYMVIRAFPLFSASENVLNLICWVGALTAFFGACLAFIQDNLKKMLAFSACAQLGYMLGGLGAKAPEAAYLHLVVYACASALLFLLAGSITQRVQSDQMSSMGGLKASMKLTWILYAIASFSLVGFPLTSGFFSRDMIMAALYDNGQLGPMALCMGAFLLTAVFMTRSFIRIFHGTENPSHRETEFIRWLPMVVLAAGSILLIPYIQEFLTVWGAPIPEDWQSLVGQFFGIPAITTSLMCLGIAYGLVRRGGSEDGGNHPLGDWLRSEPINRIYERLYTEGLRAVARIIAWVDRWIIDAAMHCCGYLIISASERVRRIHTGRVSDCLWIIAFGAVVFIMLALMGGFPAGLNPMQGGQ